MNIKFKALQRDEGQTAQGKVWVAYKIIGTKIDDGTEWSSSNIFDNKYGKDVLDKARKLQEGDKIDIKLEKNGKFWNVKDIVEYTGPPAAKVYSGTGGGGNKGDYKWQGRKGEAYDRSAAIYLAMDIVKSTTPEKELQKLNPEDLARLLFMLANGLFEYINMGNDQVSMVSGDDPLTPPEV